MRTFGASLWAGLAGALLALAAGGCERRGAPADAGPAADERLRNAIGSYVEGYNLLGESVNALLERFAAAAPTGVAPGAVRLEPVHGEVGACLKRAREEFEVGKRDGGEALAALAPLADRLRSAARKVMKTYAEAEHYHASGGAREDGGKGAAKYQEEMRLRGEEFRRALSDLAVALDGVEDRQAQAELDALAARKDAGYWFRRANQAAKRLMGAARALPEQGELSEARRVLQEVAGQIDLFVASRKADLPGAFGAYTQALGRLLASSERLAEAVRSGEPDTWLPAKKSLFEDYNALIQAGNALYDLEEQGR